MNCILIIAHTPLASALRQCAMHVFPDSADSVATLDVQPNQPPEETAAQARILMEQTMQRSGATDVLVLTDIFGATPCNVAQKLVDGLHSKLICGVNVPMLVRAVSYRAETLDAMVQRALVGGTQGVMQVAITTLQNQNRPKNDPDHYHHQQ